MPFKSHEEFMREYLADPEMAAAYLNACIEDGNPWLIADAFKTVEAIHGPRTHFRMTFDRQPVRTRRTAQKARRTPAKRTRKVAA
ncbi:MAG TPA: hypothetical protein VG537_03525 [Candidatus Kapabacteria bacterium]|jgi:hypothetical protein|nr:hypothetical protein [Candidatus Kapabacteria bacterium]